MPIQWGRRGKKLAEMGLELCDFCHEPAPHSIYEFATEVKFMYLVPLGSVGQELGFVCERCGHTQELDANRRQEILEGATRYPNNNDSISIWNALDETVADWLKDKPRGDAKSVFEILQPTANMLAERFPKHHVDLMVDRYLAYCADED